MNKAITALSIFSILACTMLHSMQRQATARIRSKVTTPTTQQVVRHYTPLMTPIPQLSPLTWKFNPLHNLPFPKVTMPKVQLPRQIFQIKSYTKLMEKVHSYSEHIFQEMLHETLETYAIKKMIGSSNIKEVEHYFIKEYFDSNSIKYLEWQRSMVTHIRGKILFSCLEYYEHKLGSIGLSSEESKIYHELLENKNHKLRRYSDYTKKTYDLFNARSQAQTLAKKTSSDHDSLDQLPQNTDPIEQSRQIIGTYNPVPYQYQAAVEHAAKNAHQAPELIKKPLFVE